MSSKCPVIRGTLCNGSGAQTTTNRAWVDELRSLMVVQLQKAPGRRFFHEAARWHRQKAVVNFMQSVGFYFQRSEAVQCLGNQLLSEARTAYAKGAPSYPSDARINPARCFQF